MILTVTFIAVGVKRLPLWHWLIVITIYCLVDNYLSYGQLDVTHLRLQLGTMLVFVGMVGIGRPYVDRWFMKTIKIKSALRRFLFIITQAYVNLYVKFCLHLILVIHP